MNKAIVLYAEDSFEPLTVVELPEKFITQMAERGYFELPLLSHPALTFPTGPPTIEGNNVIGIYVELLMRKGKQHWIFTIPDNALQQEGELHVGYLEHQKKDVVDRVWRGYSAGRVDGIIAALLLASKGS